MKSTTYLLLCASVLLAGSAAWGADALVDRSAYQGNTLKGPWGEVGFNFKTGADPEVVRGLGMIDLNNTTPLTGPDGDGLKSAVTVTLWLQSNGSKVVQAVVPAGTGGELYDGFRYAGVPETTLSADTNYVLSFNSGAILDSYLDANKGTTLNPIYVGAQPSSTWQIRWGGTIGVMPTDTASWGVGRTYGCVNMRPAPVGPKATNPNPQHNATDVSCTTNLGWTPTNAPLLIQQKVYFSKSPTDPNLDLTTPIKTGDQTMTSVSNPELGFTLGFSSEYRWRVDSVINHTPDPNTYEGSVWSFTTVPPHPLFTQQPENAIAAPGASASFTVVAFNPVTGDSSGMTYQWYKEASGDDVMLAEEPNCTGVTTTTLTLNDVNFLEDDGGYYCIADNGNPWPSNTAFLTVRQLMAHLTMNGTLADSAAVAGGDNSGTYVNPSGGPVPPLGYDTGIISSAVILTPDPNHVQLANTTTAFNFYTRSLTVSAWVKTTQAAWGCIASKQYRVDPNPWLGWVLDMTDTGTINFNIRGVGGPTSTDLVNNGAWHLVTATYNPTTGIARLYIDGQLDGQSTGLNPAGASATSTPVLIGAETETGSTPFGGMIDDVQIYNHALTSLEVAKLYFNVYPDAEDFCLDGDYPEGDLNLDCRVDLKDFAILASDWLNCNLVPTCVAPEAIP